MVHSLEEEEGEVGRLQVNREGEAVVVGAEDRYLGVAVGVVVVVVVLLCCQAEGVEVVVEVLRDPGAEVEGVVEGVVAEVPQSSD